MSGPHNRLGEESIGNHDIASTQELDKVTSRLIDLVSCRPAVSQIRVLIKLEEEINKLRLKCVHQLANDGEGQLAEVARRAIKAFDDGAAAWLFSQNYALGWQIPAALLDTEEGVKSVLDTIGRIE